MSTVSAPIATERIQVEVDDGTKMYAYVARPPRPVKDGPGIVVLQEAYGVTDWLREVTARFAHELGFVAIAPELYHRTGDDVVVDYAKGLERDSPHRKGLTVDGMARDVAASHAWLCGEGVRAERSAAVGFCMGGRAAYLGNARAPFGAAISFYGGRIAPDSVDEAPTQHGPLLCFWGGLDKTISIEHRRGAEDALNAAGKVHTQVVFSDADHGFFRHVRPEVYHPGASRQAWAMLVEFLRFHNVID